MLTAADLRSGAGARLGDASGDAFILLVLVYRVCKQEDRRTEERLPKPPCLSEQVKPEKATLEMDGHVRRSQGECLGSERV